MKFDRDRYPALTVSLAHSRRILAELGSACGASPQVLSPLSVIAAAGSLGRLEATAGSDLDAILVGSPGEFDTHAESAALEWLWRAVGTVGLRSPKGDGIFRRIVTRGELLAPDAIGRLDESPGVFGKRIQILLDSRAILGEHEFSRLRSDVLDWYLQSQSRFRLPGPWHYLMADLLRYANAYGNWQSTKLGRTDDDSWALRQIKLRSTRFVTWAGLWLLILRARDMPGEGIDWVRANLALTPIERIRLVVEPEAPQLVEAFLDRYEFVHARMTTPGVRSRFVHSGLPDGEVDPRTGAEFDEIMSECKSMRAGIARYVASRFATSASQHEMAVPF